LRGEPLTIYGDGSQTRSFCYCSDLIDGILRLSQSDVHDPVNIGNPQEWTILECAQQVQSVVGSRSEIVFEPLPQDDPLRRRPDITLARNLLGWSPKIALHEGLGRSMQYFAACIENEKARV
jgi:dTDP-glucose 4,6-dehydratase